MIAFSVNADAHPGLMLGLIHRGSFSRHPRARPADPLAAGSSPAMTGGRNPLLLALFADALRYLDNRCASGREVQRPAHRSGPVALDGPRTLLSIWIGEMDWRRAVAAFKSAAWSASISSAHKDPLEASSVRDLRDGKCAASRSLYRRRVSVASVRSPESHNFSDLGSADRLIRRQGTILSEPPGILAKLLQG
jgi:hypothetical protein